MVVVVGAALQLTSTAGSKMQHNAILNIICCLDFGCI